MVEIVVLPIHFEDRSGTEFERLCFAYVLRTRQWTSIDWYGQLGKDRGRDILGAALIDDSSYRVSYQCVNHLRLNFKKAREDIDKIVNGPDGVPAEFILILGGKVSSNMRRRVIKYALDKGIQKVEVWSGTEFEERLRRDTPDLIRRFCQGEVFPDSAYELRIFAVQSSAYSDNEILELFARCFDRPAFITPFMSESSLPDFKKAITDTIEVLNTGIYRLRDGTIISQIPSRHQIKDKQARVVLSEIVDKLTELRNSFDIFSRSGEIRHCSCNNPNCPVYFINPNAAYNMDGIREQILKLYKSIYPKFGVKLRHFNMY